MLSGTLRGSFHDQNHFGSSKRPARRTPSFLKPRWPQRDRAKLILSSFTSESGHAKYLAVPVNHSIRFESSALERRTGDHAMASRGAPSLLVMPPPLMRV